MKFSTGIGLLLLGSVATCQAGDPRDNNGGNCVGVKSCRPRCVTFRLDREVQDCSATGGIFTVQTRLNPWDIKRFRTFNCPADDPADDTCFNDECGKSLTGDLKIRVGEQGHSGSNYYTMMDLAADEDRFTFCSIYPCAKDECAVPEQMGTELQFEYLRNDPDANATAPDTAILVQKLYLKAAFVGPPLQRGTDNNYGPLHIEWMDDPTGCRTGDFSEYAPVMPLLQPAVSENTTNLPEDLYCKGPSYEDTPLPKTRPPTSAPSSAPTTRSPTNSNSPIGLEQIEGLLKFYDATEMSKPEASELHNWFKVKDYCDFTGVKCNTRGYVTQINLALSGLSGSLPTAWHSLPRLQQLKVVGNKIGGPIPSGLSILSNLAQLEIGGNEFTGTIPTELKENAQLRRLIFKYNNLHGTLHEDLCELKKLMALDISGNTQMHGIIPECIGNLPLEVLRVGDVGLVGKVPLNLCNIRAMNGLKPNTFSCDAIACPAGYYEPSVGRQLDEEGKCLECPGDSNVIGSTVCQVLDGNDIVSAAPISAAPISAAPSASFAPSTMPPSTQAPTMKETAPGNETTTPRATIPPPTVSMAPSISMVPTVAPPTTAAPTAQPSSLPSQVPSAVPSSSPSTWAPSASPSLGTVGLRVTLGFADIVSEMNANETQAFESFTKDFLAARVSDDTVIERVVVVSQVVKGYTENGLVMVAYTPDRRLMQDDDDMALYVDVDIQGTSEDGSFKDEVETGFDDFETFVDKLAQEVPMFEEPEPVDQKATIPGDEQQNGTNWWLLGCAVGLSFVAIGTVWFVRSSRQSRQNQSCAADGSMNPPSFQDEDIVFDPSIALADVPADQMDNLSVESSSGWNSESSPGEFVNGGGAASRTSAGEAASAVSEWSQQDLYMMSSAAAPNEGEIGEQLGPDMVVV